MIGKIQSWLEEKVGLQLLRRQIRLILIFFLVIIIAIILVPTMRAKKEINKADDSFYIPAE